MFLSQQSESVVDDLAAIRDALGRLDGADGDAVLIDRIRLLEEIKAAAGAAQARATARFVASQRADHLASGVQADRVGRGVPAQVGLARRMSPCQAARYTSQVTILTTDLPGVFARFAAGVVPEWRVLQVAQQAAWLSPEHRAVVDAEIAPQLEQLGNRKAVDATNKIAYRLDPHGYLKHLARAESERHVSIRPAPDCMARLSALLPVKLAVAAYAALHAHAAATVGHGTETRTRGQVMSDTLVERITGQASATDVPVTVNLIMTDQTLFSTSEAVGEPHTPDEPAHLVGSGTIPAELARRMVRDPSGKTAIFLRRLYTNPTTGQLAAMDSQARMFTANERHFLLLRDQTCRTPWCDAPVRHADHVQSAEQGGPTSIANGQGLCEACNYSKEAAGWHQYVDQNTPGDIVTVTPTGHYYCSRPPDPPGRTRPTSTSPTRKSLSRPQQSSLERQLLELIRAAA